MALIVAVLAYLNSPSGQKLFKKNQPSTAPSKQVKVPEELVLGERVQAQSKFNLANPDSYDSVFFNTPKTEKELISFYYSKLTDEGWIISMDTRLKNGNYLINARKGVRQIDVTIFDKHLAGSANTTTLVSIIYKD